MYFILYTKLQDDLFLKLSTRNAETINAKKLLNGKMLTTFLKFSLLALIFQENISIQQ